MKTICCSETVQVLQVTDSRIPAKLFIVKIDLFFIQTILRFLALLYCIDRTPRVKWQCKVFELRTVALLYCIDRTRESSGSVRFLS